MSKKEAADILGVQENASKDEIILAHKREIQKHHPDKGGTKYMAIKINAAKERGMEISYEEARDFVYGMPYSQWKEKYQKEATKEQLEKFNSRKK